MKIVIANGGNNASYIIEMFKNRQNDLVVINSDRAKADEIVKKEHVPVYVGTPFRQYVLEEAGVKGADVFVSLCEKDTDNYAACTLAKKMFDVKKVICLVNNPRNVDLFKKLGIDSVISGSYLLAQSIQSESSMESLIKTLSLDNNKVNVIEAVVLSRYKIANQRIMDIDFPKYASIAAIYRNFQILIPNGQIVLKPKDVLMIVTAPENHKRILSFLQEVKEEAQGVKSAVKEATNEVKEKVASVGAKSVARVKTVKAASKVAESPSPTSKLAKTKKRVKNEQQKDNQ